MSLYTVERLSKILHKTFLIKCRGEEALSLTLGDFPGAKPALFALGRIRRKGGALKGAPLLSPSLI
jgi:hypothetical protein